ncbi:2,3-bisphosphoglycerate-independent phosphoglycerate mutase [Candidatus Bathyarchaeota archaeon]|nr:2,3-bisphosphoglycerate-independent phosphoglycerate mutase [Candidatus Bathyarchaeota archaeon]
MKAILIICDGMADRPVKELSWKTPLEAAYKPSLNQIAKTGICGIMDLIAPGIPPGSDSATLALLGYDALKVYSGRGAFEAVGSGVQVLPGDVAFRCNFATANEKLVVLDRRAGRIENEDADKLAQSLQKIKLKTPSVKFLFKNTIQHRAVLVIRGPKLSTAVSDSDPQKTGEKVLEIKPLNTSFEAKYTAKILNELAHQFHTVLKDHSVNKQRVKRKLLPANIILCRGAGTIPKIKPLSELYGVKAACIAATSLIRGVCEASGMKLINVKGATGTPQTDFLALAKATNQVLRTFDFVLLHVKATDVASHDRNIKQKVEMIEKVDNMVGRILNNIDLNSVYLAITADHTTSLATGNHEGDPVPIAITGPYVRRDDVERFDERCCAKGGLNRIRGMDLMPTLMNLLGKTKKFGA